MAEFNILDHIDKLTPDKGSAAPGEQSFFCPVCEAKNFKVHLTNGKWNTFSCDCAATEQGKRNIRNALSPAINPNKKDQRPKQHRAWDYHDINGNYLFTVHRWDDPFTTDKRFRNGRCIRQTFSPAWEDDIDRQQWRNEAGQKPADLGHLAAPYGLKEAAQALADGAPYVLWVEGEPCVDSLRRLGIPAITSLGGCSNFNSKRDAGHIPPDRLVAVPDRDKPGLKYAKQVADAHPGCQWLYPFPGTPQWNGSCPPDGGLDIADWIAQGATVDQILDGIGEQLKPGAKPSGEAQGDLNDIRDEFLRDGKSLKERLDRGLEQIDAIPDVATRSVTLHALQKSLDLSDKKFELLIKALAEAKAPKATESFDDLMAEDDEDLTALVDDLFPTGLILIAAEGFAGKSNTAYQIAEAVTNGTKFAGQFQCQRAPALIIQMDESKTDAKRKFKVLGLQPAKGALTIKWHFSPMMFPELRRWVSETGAKLVILDSLMTIAGGQISPKDAEFGLLIYRLNQLAAELGLTIICLHHVVKAQGVKRTEIAKEDIYGTAYVYNGASEAWGLWQSREDGSAEPVFKLRCLKARSGLVDQGTTYQFEGNDEDKRLTFRGIEGRTITLDQIKSTRDRVLAYLKGAKGAALDPKTVNERLQLGNADYARRLCRELFEKPSVPVGRKLGNSSGGRPAYLYFWAGGDSPAINTCAVTAESPSHTGTFQNLREGFSTPLDPSEKGESEGVGVGFQHESVLTRASPEDSLPDGYLDDLPF